MKVSDEFLLAVIASLVVAVAIAIVLVWDIPEARSERATTTNVGKASLTVVAEALQPAIFPIRHPANGNITAWQEASVGTESNGLRLTAVKVNVGDQVRRGQLLATFAADTVQAELAQGRAAAAEAEVTLVEATANARRARLLQESDALSAQQIHQYLSAESTARARLDAARAVEKTQLLRLAQTRIYAPDDGIISARTATVGAVFSAGQELFRLIRGGRLEWRAEVAAADLAKLKPGQAVRLTPSGGESIEGTLRMLAPVIDIQTRNGMVYVDLPPNDTLRAGMFARGEFDIGASEVMTLPQSAVQLRDGFSYVMRVGPDSHTIQTKVVPGRRVGDRVQITSGLDKGDRVVISGAAFLSDGDLVLVADSSQKALRPTGSQSVQQRLTPIGSAEAP